jgi:hypothetical protein
MKNRRTTFSMFVAALSLASFWPATAWANPLLSGYGGPGEGSQEILGAQLLGGPAGGRGGGPKGGGGGPTTGAGSGTSANSSEPTAGASASRRGGSRSPGAKREGAAAHSRTLPAGHRPARQAASEQAIAGSDGVGLSGEDVLYMALALVALSITGVLTAVLVRRPPSGHSG